MQELEDKEWEETQRLEVWEVKGKESVLFVIKKNIASECVEILCFQTVSNHVNKKVYVLTGKILCEIKKIESGNNHSVERGFPKLNFA